MIIKIKIIKTQIILFVILILLIIIKIKMIIFLIFIQLIIIKIIILITYIIILKISRMITTQIINTWPKFRYKHVRTKRERWMDFSPDQAYLSKDLLCCGVNKF
jgi:hypothetical protein